MAANVTLTGDLTKRMRRGEKRTAAAVGATAKDITKRAKARVPVDTGHLRKSIEPERIDEYRALVTVDTVDEKHSQNYAGFVEYGTRHMAAQPFLIPAAEAARQPFARRISKAYEQ